ncbi:DegV family protein [Collinsella sp. AGMB00827]|uniref:DegV family protein n=1 Tax=Collinsella ureilytica TaxID=2869515 RepID=A0ABS7MI06_9ACTN|nr:DegV family protein [Collinsella urealyticum]MBY4796983.1 DegV family protein [Collinsella urealyticum]
MATFTLSTCSTADYPRAFFSERNILCLYFHYQMDGSTYPDDLYESISPEQFFGKIKAGSQPTTSQVATGDYVDVWRPYLERGSDILHIALSSGISGSYNSALLARDELAEEFPDRTIHVIDSLGASGGLGLLVEYAADLRDEGKGIDEVAAWVEQNRLSINSWFYVSDLECLKRGGRISATSAWLATALKICPVLEVDRAGTLQAREKIRTKRRAIAALASICIERLLRSGDRPAKCTITHSVCREDAEEVARLIVEGAPELAGKIKIHNIGTVIGAHTGPGAVALFFLGKPRES